MDTPTSRQLPRDVFLYFLMIFALATSAVDLGTIFFQLINLYIPGAAGFMLFGAQGAIRFAVSSLIIVFPVLVWVLWFLNKDMALVPAKRDLKIRKWLLYFTLFITGLTVIGDLVTLVYTFMQGDITLRFILKVLVVFWLAGSVFYYFLKDLHNQSSRGRKIIAWTTIGITAAALIAGFVIAGSPASQRALANDQTRVADLQSLEYQIIAYWQAKNKLPATLADLPSGAIGGYVVPTDPLTGESYIYTTLGPLSYELCATFQTASQMDIGAPQPYGVGVSNWQHQSGYQCFDGKIDPARVMPFAPKPL